jgi:hypothetical protein
MQCNDGSDGLNDGSFSSKQCGAFLFQKNVNVFFQLVMLFETTQFSKILLFAAF